MRDAGDDIERRLIDMPEIRFAWGINWPLVLPGLFVAGVSFGTWGWTLRLAFRGWE